MIAATARGWAIHHTDRRNFPPEKTGVFFQEIRR